MFEFLVLQKNLLLCITCMCAAEYKDGNENQKIISQPFGEKGSYWLYLKRNEDDTVGLHFKVGSDRFWFFSWNPYSQAIVFFKLHFAGLDSVQKLSRVLDATKLCLTSSDGKTFESCEVTLPGAADAVKCVTNYCNSLASVVADAFGTTSESKFLWEKINGKSYLKISDGCIMDHLFTSSEFKPIWPFVTRFVSDFAIKYS